MTATAASPTDLDITAATLPDAFQLTAARNAHRVALRTLNDETALTWAQYASRVAQAAAALAGAGVRRGQTVGLMIVNSPEFHILDTALLHLGAIPVSIYNTLPAAEIAWILDDAGVRLVVAGPEFVPVLTDVIRQSGSLERIVSISDGSAETTTFAELVAKAPDDFDFESTWRAVEPTDIATVSYTSGTTGHPKGVLLSHRGILGSLAGLDSVLGTIDGGRTVSFLPFAHVAERMFSHYRGMVYGLTVTSCPNPALIGQYLVETRPHYVFAPPRLFEKLRAAIEARIDSDEAFGPAARAALETGYEVVDLSQSDAPIPDVLASQYAAARQAYLTPLLAGVGLDSVAVALTGAAPVPPPLVRFFLALGLQVLEAWGMSECSAFGAVNRPGDARIGTVGRPLPGLEARLLEDGEILLRSPWLMVGYLNRPELTAETIDEDGWLHTGDIGAFDEDGRLSIVDRKKELIINASGKNMSPANIEATLKAGGSIIGQVIVIGDARPYNVALIVPDPEAASVIRTHASGDAEEAIAAAIDLAVEAANRNLARVEQIKKYAVLDTEWLPGGDELSPTMKLKRKPIHTKYAAAIESLYAPVGAPA